MRDDQVFTPDFAVMMVHDVEQVQTVTDVLRGRPDLVARADSMATYMPADRAVKAPLVHRIRAAARRLPELRLRFDGPPRPATLIEELEALSGYLAVDVPLTLKMHDREALIGPVKTAAKAVQRLRDRVAALPADVLARRLRNVEGQLADIAPKVVGFMRSDAAWIAPSALPAAVRNAYWRHGEGGDTFAIRIFPAGSFADRAFMASFRTFVRSIDPDVTGLPITFLVWGELFRDSLYQAAGVALLIIALLLLVDFRSVGHTLLGLLPIALGLVWMMGIIEAVGVRYTPANVLAIPLILGIGIDSGVHIMHRYRQGTPPADLLRTTGKAVAVSSMTTIIAFGSLMAAEHRGPASLGLILSAGVLTCLAASVLVLPALLELLERARKRGGPRHGAPSTGGTTG